MRLYLHSIGLQTSKAPHVLLPVVTRLFVVILQALLQLYFQSRSTQTSAVVPSAIYKHCTIVLPQHRIADFKAKGSTCPSSCRHPAFCRHPTSIVAIALPQHKHPDFSPCSFCHLQTLVRLYVHSLGLQTSKKQQKRLYMSFFLSSSGLLSSSYKHCCNCTSTT